jgi:OmcA/MtrC family decaheme c-type cytochrome
MRVSSHSKLAVRLGVIVALLAGCAALISATKPPFSKKDKAYYLDERTANFVRPGLYVKVYDASVADDGTIKARVKVQDRETSGIPLDKDGIETPGTVSLSFIAAFIPQDQEEYTAYTVRPQTSPITGKTANQAGTDSGGTYTKLATGDYEYTFKTKAPAGFDKTATHSIGVYASRNLADFDLGTYYDDDVFNFVPNGSPVVKVRDIIRTETCNKCHDQIAFHGGPRRSVELCDLCHTVQTTDPDTGNPLDLPQMIHKIHYGSSLTKGYTIIGHNQSVNDYSDVTLPSDARACSFCHEPGPTQADAWYTRPTRKDCGACHDNVNFATGENHAGGLPEFDDKTCTQCHIPFDAEFDASIKGAHTIPEESTMLPGLVFEVMNVTDGLAGQAPVVQFSVKNKAGEPYDVSKISRMSIVLAGSTTDYTQDYSEDPRAKATGSNGVYSYQMTTKIPADAKGTWTVGLEGYNSVTLLPGTVKEVTVRDAAVNKTMDFSVDNTPVVARRTVVTTETCDTCHRNLSLHGGNRNQIAQCVLCHNPEATDADMRPADQKPDESIDLALMVHRIHGASLQTRPLIIYGHGNSANNFSDVGYPGELNNCSHCHVNGSYNVPLPRTNVAMVDPRGLLSPVMPATGACTACHTSIDAASHALANTSILGESCGACHGDGKLYSVDKMHAQ